MFRNGIDIENKFKVNCIVTGGGIGDVICYLVAVDYILKTAPWLDVHVWVANNCYEFAKHVLPNANINQIKDLTDNGYQTITTLWNTRHTALRTHPVEYGFHMLADYSPKSTEMNYLKFNNEGIDLTKFNLPEKYVVLQGAYFETVKTMPDRTFKEIKEYCLSKGYQVILLGKTTKDSTYSFKNCINLIDQTSMIESTAIMEKAAAVIGMDSGLIHMAGFTDVPIVCGYTFAKPAQLMPIRRNQRGWQVYPVTPDRSLGCRFCQSNWTLFFGKDFRECSYGDFACVNQMTGNKFIHHLEKIL